MSKTNIGELYIDDGGRSICDWLDSCPVWDSDSSIVGCRNCPFESYMKDSLTMEQAEDLLTKVTEIQNEE